MTRHLLKRSLNLSGHGTSVALEAEFWRALEGMAQARNHSLTRIVESIDASRAPDQPLASALRVAALLYREGADAAD